MMKIIIIVIIVKDKIIKLSESNTTTIFDKESKRKFELKINI